MLPFATGLAPTLADAPLAPGPIASLPRHAGCSEAACAPRRTHRGKPCSDCIPPAQSSAARTGRTISRFVFDASRASKAVRRPASPVFGHATLRRRGQSGMRHAWTMRSDFCACLSKSLALRRKHGTSKRLLERATEPDELSTGLSCPGFCHPGVTQEGFRPQRVQFKSPGQPPAGCAPQREGRQRLAAPDRRTRSRTRPWHGRCRR